MNLYDKYLAPIYQKWFFSHNSDAIPSIPITQSVDCRLRELNRCMSQINHERKRLTKQYNVLKERTSTKKPIYNQSN